MTIKDMLATVTKLANIASVVLPQAKIVGGAADLGGKILDIIDGLKDQGDPAEQADMQLARDKLATAVKAKAKATSARLRG